MTATIPTKFSDHMLLAYALLQATAKIPCLTEIQRTQAETARDLCGLTLHTISGQPHGDNLRALADDLTVIAEKVDRLVAVIGAHACDHAHGIDQKYFDGQLLCALSGDGLYQIREAADQLDYDLAQPDPDAEYDRRRDDAGERAALAAE